MKESGQGGSTEIRSEVREILVQQFLLHELGHHALPAAGADPPAPILPRAHQLMDIYKCLHQGEFGVEHNIDHPLRFRQRLLQEIQQCGPEDPGGEPLIETLSAAGDGPLRVNLRPLRRFMGEDSERMVEDLCRVCFESAPVTQGNINRFYEKLLTFKAINETGELRPGGYLFGFPAPAVDHFLMEVRHMTRQLQQIPVFSHSEGYRQLNRPAYRVVERSVLEASPLKVFLGKEPEHRNEP
jgi:hypothetical protein